MLGRLLRQSGTGPTIFSNSGPRKSSGRIFNTLLTLRHKDTVTPRGPKGLGRGDSSRPKQGSAWHVCTQSPTHVLYRQ
jgi:hypothetical protein